MNVPPDQMVRRAIQAAIQANCHKSKRGAVVFERVEHAGRIVGVYRGIGANGPPRPMLCDATDPCRAGCPRIAVHAERRALDDAIAEIGFGGLTKCELIHVKVNEHGALVASGSPSCAECSKHLLELGVRGIWLYEASEGPRGEAIDEWFFYEPLRFHLLTLQHERNKLYAGPIAP